MRVVSSLIFLILVQLCQAQETYFELFAKSGCTGQVYPIYSYTMISPMGEVLSNTNTKDSPAIDNRIVISGLGTYTVFMGSDEQFNVEIQRTGYHSDTVVVTRKIETSFGLHGPIIYECCNQVCEGVQVDFWENGNMKIRGTFVAGQPIDTLTKYYRSGVIKSIEIYKKRNNTTFEFDSLGQLSFNLYSNSNKTSYENYKDNQLVKKVRWRKFKNLKSYEYEAGKVILARRKKSLKLFKNESDKQILLESWKKKRIAILENFCWDTLVFWRRSYCYGVPSYRYKIRKFDSEKNVTAMLSIETWGFGEFDFQASFLKADWIESLSIIENGKLKKLSVDKAIEDLNQQEKQMILKAGFK